MAFIHTVYVNMPRYLTEQDIADFRAELCKVATERFARFGYEGVTMRQLAEALGCSPKTPYRYFKDKADILATVRAQAFAKFADALEKAAAGAERSGRARPADQRGLSRASRSRTRTPIASCSRSMRRSTKAIPSSGRRPSARRATSRAAPRRWRRQASSTSIPRCSAGRCGRRIHGIVMLHQSGMLTHGPDYKALAYFLGLTDAEGRRRQDRSRRRRRGRSDDGGRHLGRAVPQLGRDPGQCRARRRRLRRRSASARTTAWR